MRTENKVAPEAQLQVNTGKRAFKQKKKTSKDTKVSGANILSNRVEQYDVDNWIAQANAGINIGKQRRRPENYLEENLWEISWLQ